MTISNAIKKFVYSLIGQTPTGNNIADVIKDGASKSANALAKSSDLTSLSGTVTTLSGTVTTLSGTVTTLSGTVTTLNGIAVKYEDAETQKSFVLKSSTADSTKSFRITVIDDGTIAATEIT